MSKKVFWTWTSRIQDVANKVALTTALLDDVDAKEKAIKAEEQANKARGKPNDEYTKAQLEALEKDRRYAHGEAVERRKQIANLLQDAQAVKEKEKQMTDAQRIRVQGMSEALEARRC